MAACPRCGEQNSDQARFCQACGSPLGAPKREERKIVSVLFVDLVNFTLRSDGADPEDVRARIRPYQARVKAELESFGGTVEKFIGDAVVAAFGAPVSHGDDSERAVRAGLGVLQALEALSRDDPDLDLNARAAVTTGEVIVTLGARPELGETFVTGDVVNTASRLQSVAPVGALIVDRATYEGCRGAIRFDPLEPVAVKGKAEPVAVWRAAEPIAAPAERLTAQTPIVGRERELAWIRSTWAGVTEHRRPHMLTLLGPPGIGKSRLARQAVTIAEEGDARVLRGRSLPYRQGAGYGGFAQQVQSLAGILESDGDSAALEKLTRATSDVLPAAEANEVVAHVALLVGLDVRESVGDRQPLFFAARRLVEAVAGTRPLLLVFEDIHWADPSLLDLIEFLASRVRDVPLMLLALARPELMDRRPGWGGGLVPNTSVHLEALSEVDSAEMARLLLPAEALGGDLAARLATTSEGNPLFIEELAASMAERLAGLGSELPTNIRTTIAGRLDALPPAAREVVLDAAVVGRLFWRGALRPPASGEPLDAALDVLEERDLIRREPASLIEGERQYIFKHILIREVAYSTLPRAERRERHADVARFIEERAGARLSESASLLAHHWREAGDLDLAVDYLLRAAEGVARGWAKQQAVDLYEEALGLVAGGARAEQIELRLALTLLEVGDYLKAVPHLDHLLQTLTGQDRLVALLSRGRASFWNMDPLGARDYSEQALRLAQELGDRELLGPALALRSHAASMEGDMPPAFADGDRALEVWMPGARPLELAIHLEQHALHYYWTGSYGVAREHALRSYELADDIQSVESLLRAGATLGMALTGLGRTEDALTQFDRVIGQARELEIIPRWTARALNMSSSALRDAGDFRQARERGQEAIELGRRAGFALAEIQAGIDILFTDLDEDEIGRAAQAWPELWVATGRTQGWHQWLMTHRLSVAKARISLRSGDPASAAAAAEDALRLCRQVGRLKYEVAAISILAQALLQLGEPDRAAATAALAAASAQRLGHPPAIWKARLLLAAALEATRRDGGAERAAAAVVREQFRAALSPVHQGLLPEPAL